MFNPVGVVRYDTAFPTPSCATLARGYHGFASYGGEFGRAVLGTAALGYCLYRFALSERGGLGKSKKLCDYKEFNVLLWRKNKC